MANIVDSITPTNISRVSPLGAVSMANRPLVGATQGSYACSLATGIIGAGLGAGAVLLAFRYTGSGLCVIDKVVCDGWAEAAAFTTPQPISFGLFVARSYTVSATNGTPATLTGNNCKLRTSYATTGVADIRSASTAAATAGTRTLDTTAIGGAVYEGGTAGANGSQASLYDAYSTGHPIILVANEGIEVQNRVLWGALGTGTTAFTIHWTECTVSEWGV